MNSPRMPLPDAEARLGALSQQVARELELTSYDTPAWANDSDGIVPVLVVGAGQAGLAVSVGLRRKGIEGVMVVDAAAADKAGPWASYARMRTLRTPKNLKWVNWELPSTTPQAWFEAVYGPEAWQSLELISTADWHEFLTWYRSVLGVEVSHRTTVESVDLPAPSQPFTVELQTDGARRAVRAQRIVFATGLDGAGGPRVPSALFAHLPSSMWNHIHDDIDFASLRGKRIGILGAGTGAFDNAATALEAGAASAVVHMRRPAMPTSSPYRWMEFPPIIEHYADLPDAEKLRFNQHLSAADQPATQNAIWRAFDHEGFEFRTSSPWLSTELVGDVVKVTTADGVEEYDHLFAATGMSIDLGQRSEYAAFVDDIALWSERFAPAADTALGAFPYLSDGFALVSSSGAHEEQLSRLHLFNHAARMSCGVLSHQIPGLTGGAPRLVDAIAAGIVRERSTALIDEFCAFSQRAIENVGPRPKDEAVV